MSKSHPYGIYPSDMEPRGIASNEDERCCVPGCLQIKRYRKTFCFGHLKMLEQGRSFDRVCKMCGSEFIYLSRSLNGEGRFSRCQSCQSLFKKFKQFTPSIAVHNLSILQFMELLELQNNSCALCHNRTVSDLHIDHDHKCCSVKQYCGHCVRGLLCHNCNCMIGFYENHKGDLMIEVFEEYLARNYFVSKYCHPR
jgi:hypothetical protein